ncbi:MAG: RuBisCO accumulation factor 1 [Xenococcaceae cyanobacterium]
MTEQPQDTPPPSYQLSEDAAQELLRSLRRKEGNWVEWGKACQKLQKAGYNPQKIFEETGFQASQQNQIIVAAQVYESIVKAGVSEEVRSHLVGPRSDILYEFRILNQKQRAAAAEMALEKKLDLDGAHAVARAIKDFSRLSRLPEGFSNHPGDAVAYQCWKWARGKKDIQERSRLIAQGLKFAHSQTAREQIEKLLTDFTVVPPRKAPLLPVYRLEAEEELPRIIPFAGSLPLTRKELEAIPIVEESEPFRGVKFSGTGVFVPLPGWQAILKAEEPVAILCQSDGLPQLLSGKSKAVLVVVDRRSREWNVNSYFLVEQGEQLEFQWFEQSPEIPILGQVILVLRPKNIIDENVITEPWQMDD